MRVAQRTDVDGGAPGRGVGALPRGPQPVQVTADRFTLDNGARRAVWTGNVLATRGDTTLTCERMTAHYGATQQVERLECEGGVEAVRGDKRVRGARADFDNFSGVLVLTGAPTAESGPNRMSGDEVRFDVERDRLEVKPARTVFQSAGPGAAPGGLALAAKPGAPVEIQSDSFFLEGERREAVWLGHVRVKRGETRLSCGRLTALYTQAQVVHHLQCTRGVEARDGGLWAKGERADFDPARDVLVVTGEPEAREKGNHLRGSKVTLFPGQNRVEVENAVTVFEVPKP